MVKILGNLYRWIISPALHWQAGPGYGCRYFPTCGNYLQEALHHHGPLQGSWLGLKRLLRCHPWSRRAWLDPVPEGKRAQMKA